MEFTCNNLKRNASGVRIIATVIPRIGENKQIEMIKESMNNCDYYPEIRWDLSEDITIDACIKYLNSIENEDISAIFTYRSDDRKQTEDFYSLAKDHRNFVLDMDILQYVSALNIRRDKLILSSHYLNQIETRWRMEQILSLPSGAMKLACPFTHTYIGDMLNYVNKIHSERAISIVPQNSGDRFSRIIAALLSSDFTYSYLEKPVVPGQISLELLTSILHKF